MLAREIVGSLSVPRESGLITDTRDATIVGAPSRHSDGNKHLFKEHRHPSDKLECCAL